MSSTHHHLHLPDTCTPNYKPNNTITLKSPFPLFTLTTHQTPNPNHSLEAITMMDMEDLMAPAAFGDEDILGLLAGGSLSDALASQGALPAGRGRVRGGAGEVRAAQELVVCLWAQTVCLHSTLLVLAHAVCLQQASCASGTSCTCLTQSLLAASSACPAPSTFSNNLHTPCTRCPHPITPHKHQLAGDLFEMPSLPGATTTTTSASEGGDTDAAHGGRNVSSKHTAGGSSKGTRTGSGRQHQQEEEVYGGLDMMNQDW